MNHLTEDRRLEILAVSHADQLNGVDYQAAARSAIEGAGPRGMALRAFSEQFSNDEWENLVRYLEASPDSDCACRSCVAHDFRSEDGKADSLQAV